MLKKLIILNIVFILLLSTTVFASISEDMQSEGISTSSLSDVEAEEIQYDFLFKDYSSETANELKLISILRPEISDEAINISKEIFSFSCKALGEGLVIKLLIYDEENEIFVPVKKQITDPETGIQVNVDKMWRFGISGYLFCDYVVPDEGMYEYRLLIHDADLDEDDLVIGENLQIIDYSIYYEKPISFESFLENYFWDIYFDVSKYFIPILP